MKYTFPGITTPITTEYDEIENCEFFRILSGRDQSEVWMKTATNESVSLHSGMVLEVAILRTKALILVEQVSSIQFRDVPHTLPAPEREARA